MVLAIIWLCFLNVLIKKNQDVGKFHLTTKDTQT